MTFKLLSVFFSIILLSPNLLGQESTTESDREVDLVERYVNSMSLKQKVGQLFIFGFGGKTIERNLRYRLNQYEPGSIIVFKRNIENPEQLAQLNFVSQKISLKNSGLPLFIMVDQEGGVVSRIKTRPVSPSALSMGMSQNPALSEGTGLITGNILNLLGFNMNLAPVVDISDPYSYNFIGTRSFGQNPNQVKIMSRRFATGLSKASIIPTLKHFPGHGGIVHDSHKTFPKKLTDSTELNEKDLVPFKNMSTYNYPSAVMVAHIAYPNVDPEGLPATFSKKLVRELLIEKLNYKGLIMTDDIEMFGAKVFSSVGERAIRAIEAGNDLVMVAWTGKSQRAAFSAVYNAVMEGRIEESRVDESLRKIITAKLNLNYKLPKKLSRLKFKQKLKKEVNQLKKMTNLITKQNMERAFFSEKNRELNISPKTNINVFSADWRFYQGLMKNLPNKTFFYPLSPKKTPPMETVLNRNKSSLAIYYVTGKGTARLLNRMSNALKARLIVVNSTSPGQIVNRHLYKSIIDINSRNYNSGKWLAAHINGNKIDLRRPASKNVSHFKKPRKFRKQN